MIRPPLDIPTPALLLDLDRFDQNIARMVSFARSKQLRLRPHGKTHKCPEIAHRLLAAGADGLCAAKLGEAEVFAAAGVRGLLVTTAVVGADKIRRAVTLASQAPDTTWCVDDEANVRELNEAAGRAGITLNVAVDLYFGRTGVLPGAPALALVDVIHSLPNLRFAGLQAYDSLASHIQDFSARSSRTRQSLTAALATRRAIEQRGLSCPMLSAASTGTFSIDGDLEGVTEIQPGSFIFMDVDYARLEGSSQRDVPTFDHALFVLTTVVSRQDTSAIVDGGYKAFSTDRPFTPQPVGLDDVTYAWAGDEHGRLDLTASARRLKVGDRVLFIPPHCDPTVNLYDRLYAMRGNTVEGVWDIAARGRSD